MPLQEEIDLDSLTIQVRHDDEKYQSQQIQDADRYVVLIVKCPAAALRYQLSTGEVRRFLLAFQYLNFLSGQKNPNELSPSVRL